MTLRLRWTEQAVSQLGAIAEYISLSSPIYAEQIVERIVLRLRQVQQFPESGRQVPEAGNAEVRELIESPYRIIYRVLQEAIEILAIVHGRQDR
ncbi:MAG: type II toxin-antitoxin system RelE/ParE family toxin [Gemmatimonadota bacterium]|nr:type II toxin-antitoxin system RelE/ParE family toxin [Gemmatimonadota bacterium]